MLQPERGGVIADKFAEMSTHSQGLCLRDKVLMTLPTYMVLCHLGEGYIFDVSAGTSLKNGVPELIYHFTHYIHKAAKISL